MSQVRDRHVGQGPALLGGKEGKRSGGLWPRPENALRGGGKRVSKTESDRPAILEEIS